MVRQLVDVMARDLGVPRIPGDDAEGHAFTTRTAFTALRFWVQACCIDDGYGGAMGIAPAATEQKALDFGLPASVLSTRGLRTCSPPQ